MSEDNENIVGEIVGPKGETISVSRAVAPVKVSEMTYLEAKKVRNDLLAIKNSRDLDDEENEKKKAANARMKKLVDDARKEGHLDEVDNRMLVIKNNIDTVVEKGPTLDRFISLRKDVNEYALLPLTFRDEDEAEFFAGIRQDVVRRHADMLYMFIDSEIKALPEENVSGDLDALAEKISTSIVDALERMSEANERGRDVERRELFNMVSLQNRVLNERMRGNVDHRVEEERWVDMEYRQDFYTRFDPNSEPKYVANMTVEQRRVQEARWELARSAFYKRATSSQPDRMKENESLGKLDNREMEALYEVPGVREMLHQYTSKIIRGESVVLEDGRRISFWEIDGVGDWELFRQALREDLKEDHVFINGLNDNNDEAVDDRVLELRAKEADAVAWNFIYITNLVESMNSRYSQCRDSRGRLPGSMFADDYCASMHPQEKFEEKIMSSTKGQYFGAFGNWGVTQYQMIKEIEDIKGDDTVVFEPGHKDEYWESSRSGNTVTIKVPECYPIQTARSYLEDTEAEDVDGNKDILLNHFLHDREVDWDSVNSGSWPAYQFGKFNKGIQFFDYFKGRLNKGPVLVEEDVLAWSQPLLELFSRLDMAGVIDKISKNGSKTYQTYHNLKVWGVYAGKGGVRDVNKMEATSPFGYFGGIDLAVMLTKLRDYDASGGYLDKGVFGMFSGENLDLE